MWTHQFKYLTRQPACTNPPVSPSRGNACISRAIKWQTLPINLSSTVSWRTLKSYASTLRVWLHWSEWSQASIRLVHWRLEEIRSIRQNNTRRESSRLNHGFWWQWSTNVTYGHFKLYAREKYYQVLFGKVGGVFFFVFVSPPTPENSTEPSLFLFFKVTWSRTPSSYTVSCVNKKSTWCTRRRAQWMYNTLGHCITKMCRCKSADWAPVSTQRGDRRGLESEESGGQTGFVASAPLELKWHYRDSGRADQTNALSAFVSSSVGGRSVDVVFYLIIKTVRPLIVVTFLSTNIIKLI